ncbi:MULTISPECIES: GumC family protein [Aphanothece]|uniref:GumC family protein n=1 Tax=Aphanothece TaxID=1121 RepID=UPI00398E7576
MKRGFLKDRPSADKGRFPIIPVDKAARLFAEQIRNIPLPRVFHPKTWWSNLDRRDKRRWSRYIVVSGGTNLFIWGSTLLILATAKPSYTSTFALILPGSINSVNVNLPEIGQTSASSGSAGVATSTYDPRANYQYIFTSEQVLKRAAKLARIGPKDFDKPRIKSLDNTTLMEIEMNGPSAAVAREKAFALYDAIVERLNQLRVSEMDQREGPTQKILLQTQLKLEEAQKAVSAYKLRSGLNSTDQVETISTNIEQLRRQRAEFAAAESAATGRLSTLRSDLGLSANEAAEAFKLQADQIFQKNLTDYSEATAILEVQSSKFGPNHPRITKEVKRQKAARTALLARARNLLGREPSGTTLIKLALSTSGSGRDTLFQNLVTLQSDATGAASQVRRLDQQIQELEARLQRMSQRQPTLESLKRNEKIAEAVFASTLAKLDLGQADVFAAFPLIQMAVDPSLPARPTTPKKGLLLAGAAFGSVLTSVGLWILWIRKPWIQRLSKWIST